MSFFLCTLNCNGLLNGPTRSELFSLYLTKQISILLLQETHFNNINNVENLKSLFSTDKCYFSFGSNKSRGVGIVVLNSNITVTKYYLDLEGRMVYIDITFNNIEYRIINIYAPNNEQERCQFFDDLYPFCITKKHLIIGGDFNCVLDVKLDKIGGNSSYGQGGSEKIKQIVSDFNLVDSYRFLYPDNVKTTWCSSSVSCRLDRFYMSKLISDDILTCNNIPFGHSDHDAVHLELKNSNSINFGPGYWKFNNSLLLDKNFVNSFTKYWLDLIQGIDIDLDFWEHFKDQIKLFTIHYCKKKSTVKRNVLRQLQRSYHRLQYYENNNPGQFIDRLREIKSQIKEIQLQNYAGSKIRSRAECLDNDEKPSKFFFQQEIKRAKQKTITKIVTESSRTCSSSSDILAEFQTFYSKLYTDEGIDQDLASEFLKNVPKLHNDISTTCEGPITKDEILLALRDMENNKSPGSDGLTKEFYSTFSSILIDPLVEVVNTVYNDGHLSDSQKLSYITLICKDPENSTNVKNYRPISLLNYDYKLISKVITNRVKKVLQYIVHPDQTCSVPGRTIFDNLHLMRNIIDYCEQKQMPLAFISLDQEKAFDRVSYDFLFQVLSAFNFGPSLIRWIKVLYNDVRSSVIVNNHISDPITLQRGVRQGCSLSPLLYVLCLEPFAIKIREDEQISGVKLPGNCNSIKLSLYADDSLAVCTCDESAKRVLHWCSLYGRASGAKLNIQKTKGIFMGKWKSRSDHPFGISWVDNCKLLGIKFGNNITYDDIWQPILSKFIKTLNLWKQRHLSFVEKSIVVKVLACSKLWYVGSVYLLPDLYLKQFERAIFKFLWPSNTEPLKRSVCFNYKTKGGLEIVDIKSKLQALRLKHLQNILYNDKSKYVYFSVYWVGFSLRKYNPTFAVNTRPHSSVLTSFYCQCTNDLHYFLSIQNSNYTYEFGNMLTKQYYTILVENIVTEPRIVNIFPSVNFTKVFQRLHNTFLDKYSRDIMFRIIHEIIPVSYFMHRIGFYKNNKCALCNIQVETIPHLFYECRFVKPLVSIVKNFLNILTGNEFQYFNLSHIRFHTFPITMLTKETISVCLYLISLMCYIIWQCRCSVKFEKKVFNSNRLILMYINNLIQRIRCDFYRFSSFKFSSFWCKTNLFCEIPNGELKFNVSV